MLVSKIWQQTTTQRGLYFMADIRTLVLVLKEVHTNVNRETIEIILVRIRTMFGKITGTWHVGILLPISTPVPGVTIVSSLSEPINHLKVCPNDKKW